MNYLENNQLMSQLKVRMVGGNSYGIDIPMGAYLIDVTVARQLYNFAVPGSIKILTKAYHDVTDEFIKREEGIPIPPTTENLFKIMAIVRNFQMAQNPVEEKNDGNS